MNFYKNLLPDQCATVLLFLLGIVLSYDLSGSIQNIAKCKECKYEQQHLLFEHYGGLRESHLNYTRAYKEAYSIDIRRIDVSRWFCFFKKKSIFPLQKYDFENLGDSSVEITLRTSEDSDEMIYTQKTPHLPEFETVSSLSFVKGNWNALLSGEEVDLVETKESLRQKKRQEQTKMLKHLFLRMESFASRPVLQSILCNKSAFLKPSEIEHYGGLPFRKVDLLRWKATPMRLTGTRTLLKEFTGKREMRLKFSS
ncbi:MAG: hypothetical protein AB8C84_07730 [Oligoflexales bacterium]